MNLTSTVPMTFPEQMHLERGGFVWVHPLYHPILSKSDLLTHFQLSDLRALRRKVLTDETLKQLGIPPSSYKHRSLFTVQESTRIYQVLGITWLRTNQRR